MTVDAPKVVAGGVVAPHRGLVDWLAARRVEYEIREHAETFTAESTARVEHIDPRRFAKVVGITTDDGRRALLLVDAPDHVDIAKARRLLGAVDVRILTEAEFAALSPDCDPGTIPPIPELFGLPVFADFALRDADELSFHAGSHRYTAHVDRRAWERTAGIAYGDLARDDGEPRLVELTGGTMHARTTEGATTLVWIDCEEAIIVRWADRATVERVHSDVPGRHRSTPHARIDPAIRHGGGSAAEAAERVRRERLRDLAEVAEHVPGEDDVAVVGPGIVRERLERNLQADDRRRGRRRQVHASAAERLSDEELVARVRELSGDAPPRFGTR